jgi:hypothetical protein
LLPPSLLLKLLVRHRMPVRSTAHLVPVR